MYLHNINKLKFLSGLQKQNKKTLTCRMCKLHTTPSNSVHTPLCISLHVLSVCAWLPQSDYIKDQEHTQTHTHLHIPAAVAYITSKLRTVSTNA